MDAGTASSKPRPALESTLTKMSTGDQPPDPTPLPHLFDTLCQQKRLFLSSVNKKCSSVRYCRSVNVAYMLQYRAAAPQSIVLSGARSHIKLYGLCRGARNVPIASLHPSGGCRGRQRGAKARCCSANPCHKLYACRSLSNSAD